ncbi:MAG: polysaccharide biosynthesis tyrosine autokinase [candidate division KSB1 bacterium]|nr:polysaccharide biosynthesis tyrosine autokinase [candidate division KSB1 bacterium]MDZ7294444.1 polysaccharide biosynthesis tyrosine autokinase [candidate division KSB1 bacterium]MDZ7384749.1 polysaccharide biosynthesis tyrosine autokinase [candidate division KSB1 bacterium]MDZ7391286.1 polysaccharide biosynthesis tyrosine autokinase [candidate division KSB1 bacterium]
MGVPADGGLPNIESLMLEEEAPPSQFNLGRLVRGIFRRKWIVVGVTLLAVAIAAYRASKMVPLYSATARIYVRGYEGKGGGGAALETAHVWEFGTRSFAERAAAQFGLTCELQGAFRSMAPGQVFLEFRAEQEPVTGGYVLDLDAQGGYTLKKIEGQGDVVLARGPVSQIIDSSLTVNGFTFRLRRDVYAPSLSIPFRVRSLQSAASFLQSRVKTIFRTPADVVAVIMTDTDPVRVANMVNHVAEIYIEEARNMRRRDAQRTISVLEGRARIAEEKYRASAEELRKFKQRYPFVEAAGAVQQSDVLVRLEAQQRALTDRKKALRILVDELGSDFSPERREQTGRFVVHALAQTEGLATVPEVQLAMQRLGDLERQWQTVVVGRGLTDAHPQYRELNDKIVREYRAIAEAARQYLTSLDQQEQELGRTIAQFRSQKAVAPVIMDQYAELQRQAEADGRLYNELLRLLEEERIAQSVEAQKIGFLDRATVPQAPISMGRKKVLMLGGLLGLLVGCLIAAILELADKTIRTAEDVRAFLRLQVLGAVPALDFKDLSEYDDSQRARLVDRLLVTHDYSPTPIGEAYRALRTNLLFSKQAGKIRALVITSIAPNEGKSFTAANLAIIIAQQKTNTLLVDGDLRRGVLHNTFGCPKEPGLTNYLSGTATLSEIVSETHIPNLSLVSCGALIPNPSELLGSLQMRRFIEEVRRRFDVVIFDSPPLNAATDAIVIGTQVDAMPIVIRAGKTRRDVARERLEALKNIPVNVLGVILNGVESYRSHQAYSYYHY